jgi:hypothetical protein
LDDPVVDVTLARKIALEMADKELGLRAPRRRRTSRRS